MRQCNILCSGSRRNLYSDNGLINIGCNFPWTYSDILLIHDPEVVKKWLTDKSLIHDSTKFVLNQIILSELDSEEDIEIVKNKTIDYFYIQFREFPIENFDCMVLPGFKGLLTTSGHMAAEYAILKGYEELNIFGCNAWFKEDITRNWTHDNNYLPNDVISNFPPYLIELRALRWKAGWRALVSKYNNVKFNFV